MDTKRNTKNQTILKYWKEAFENDPLYQDQCEQENPINLTSPQCALDNIKKKDWKEVKEGLCQISSYVKQNPSDLDEKRTDILKAILRHIDRPSVVTRHAVQTLKEIIVAHLTAFTDKEWERIFSVLLVYYSVAPSKQMMNEVEDILKYVITRISYHKSALILTSANEMLKHKKSKEMTAKFLKKVVVELGPYNILTENNKLGSSVLKTVAGLLACQSDVTRYYGKKILCSLMKSQALEKFLQEHVPPDLLRITIDELKVVKSKGVGQKFKK